MQALELPRNLFVLRLEKAIPVARIVVLLERNDELQ